MLELDVDAFRRLCVEATGRDHFELARSHREDARAIAERIRAGLGEP